MGVPSKPLRGFFRNLNHELRGTLGSLGVFGPLHAPILCVGSPNSGTTILGDALGSHPEVENRSEARVLWDPKFHSREGDTFRDASDARGRDRRRLRGNFAWYQRITGAKVVLNKHPENTLRIHYLMRIFPEALLIHIVRDGRAAVCSNFTSASKKAERARPFGGYMRPRGWRELLDRPLLEQLAWMWNDSVLYASTEGARYGAQFLELRYEELETQMPAIAERVWRWAGLEVLPEHLAALPKIENRNDKWRKTFSAEQLALVEGCAREGLERFGYLETAGSKR
ncbi:MAG: sulfotransferase [Planctomycetes bacterium]|nr:sulfotransferase [Planctomycetota bacterium]